MAIVAVNGTYVHIERSLIVSTYSITYCFWKTYSVKNDKKIQLKTQKPCPTPNYWQEEGSKGMKFQKSYVKV